MSLEALIRQNVHFTKLARTGFNHVHCAVCHDHSPRAGFKFDNGTVGYNCFNCGADGKYTEDSGVISKKFREHLNAFGISNDDIDKVVNAAFFKKTGDSSSSSISLSSLKKEPEKKTFLVTPEVDLPSNCFELGSTDKGLDIQEQIVTYLEKRKINFDKYKFFFSMDKRYLKYVIIPFYRNGKLIFWQGRNFLPSATKKDRFANCEASKENIIFNFDQIYLNTPAPLFVMEGVFDAMSIDGIAIIGGKLNQAKIDILKKCRREIIFVIDKDSNGKKVAEKALSNGFKITFPPPFTNDVNDSIIKYGSCWTAFQLLKNKPVDEFSSRAQIELYCGS